jgi:hypothetical protein
MYDLHRSGLDSLVSYVGSVGRTSFVDRICTRERVCLDQPVDISLQKCIDYRYGGVCQA